MFVGEAPGRNEDEQGKPFVGKAGELLNQGLELAGIDRNDVFITNAVRCRPPENRRPYVEEISSCMHFLFDEMMVVEPQVVVLLGGTSINLFASGVRVGDYHGEIIPKYKIDVRLDRFGLRKSDLPDFFGFYHPAAQIYNRSLRESFVGDCLKLKKLVK
jgi:DNA polymerase